MNFLQVVGALLLLLCVTISGVVRLFSPVGDKLLYQDEYASPVKRNTDLVNFTHSLRDGDVRLVDGKSTIEGRVEVYYRGTWGTICDDEWDIKDASVVCKSLGFSGASEASKGGVFPEGSGKIMLDDVRCIGNESSVADCNSKGWETSDCKHNEDAGVICIPADDDRNVTGYILDKSCELGTPLGSLFDNQKNCDVFITVMRDDGQSQPLGICAHRLILMLNNEANFLLKGNGSELSISVQADCLPQVKRFIRYLYSHQIKVTLASAKCIHQLASTYKVSSLQEHTAQLFAFIIPLDTSFQKQLELLTYAESSEDTKLQDLCLRYLSWNFETFSQSSAWYSLSIDQLRSLLSRTDIVIKSELDLFLALQEWITKKSVKEDSQHRLLETIRFPMMSPQELFHIQINSSLYQESKHIFQHKILQALMFHSVSPEVLNKYIKLSDDFYTPRFYTSTTWSSQFRADSGYYTRAFNSPKHTSFLYNSQITQWSSVYVKDIHTCRNYGFHCTADSLPSLRFNTGSSFPFIEYKNVALQFCNNTVTGIMQFNNKQIRFPDAQNSNQFPCSSPSTNIRVVVRPMYKFS